jgi:arylsulfatase A-like enzyme
VTEKRKSILLVTVDCLRADHTGFMGYARNTTPFLDSLAKDSLVFPAAIVGGAPTYYSLPPILASRYPLALGRDVLGIGPDEPTIASVLKQAGYATGAFSAANPYISSRFGYHRGFDIFRDNLEGEADERSVSPGSKGWASRLNRTLQNHREALGPLRAAYDELYFRYCQRVTPVAQSLDTLRRFPSADVIVDQACEWLADMGDAPFFLWLHLMDPHSPYYPKEDALRLMGDGSLSPFEARYLNSYWNRSDLNPARLLSRRDEIVTLYDAGVRWADLQLERLVAKLRQAGRWDQCILALTADHGEEFLDHGGRYHPPSELMEELIHVPLLVHVPGSGKRNISSSPFSLIHLGPTLLEAADSAVPSEFEGCSHWAKLQNDDKFDGIAVTECVARCTNPFRTKNRLGPRLLSVREERFKLILSFDPADERLYDLEADPREQSPIPAADLKPVRRRLLEAAREHVGQTSQSASRNRIQSRLRELRLEWEEMEDSATTVAS